MLEHQKIVIDKVSTDRDLFRKELIKSLKWLSHDEIIELQKWVKEKYWNIHKEVIKEVFTLEVA
jgi:hypothetical protein